MPPSLRGVGKDKVIKDGRLTIVGLRHPRREGQEQHKTLTKVHVKDSGKTWAMHYEAKVDGVEKQEGVLDTAEKADPQQDLNNNPKLKVEFENALAAAIMKNVGAYKASVFECPTGRAYLEKRQRRRQ